MKDDTNNTWDVSTALSWIADKARTDEGCTLLEAWDKLGFPRGTAILIAGYGEIDTNLWGWDKDGFHQLYKERRVSYMVRERI